MNYVDWKCDNETVGQQEDEVESVFHQDVDNQDINWIRIRVQTRPVNNIYEESVSQYGRMNPPLDSSEREKTMFCRRFCLVKDRRVAIGRPNEIQTKDRLYEVQHEAPPAQK